jgi:hypothetical protein
MDQPTATEAAVKQGIQSIIKLPATVQHFHLCAFHYRLFVALYTALAPGYCRATGFQGYNSSNGAI